MSEGYLVHHGIKGQRWGIRRYQNPDGTLTEAGKQRQIKDERKELDKQRSSMSDKDLDEAINRIKKEKQLHELINPGQTFVKAVMSDAGKKILTTAVAGAGIYAAKAFISGQFDAGELANAVFYGGAKKK